MGFKQTGGPTHSDLIKGKGQSGKFIGGGNIYILSQREKRRKDKHRQGNKGKERTVPRKMERVPSRVNSL